MNNLFRREQPTRRLLGSELPAWLTADIEDLPERLTPDQQDAAQFEMQVQEIATKQAEDFRRRVQIMRRAKPDEIVQLELQMYQMTITLLTRWWERKVGR